MHTASKRELKKGLHFSDRATNEVENMKKIFDVLVCGDGEFAIHDAIKLQSGIIDADDRKSKYFLSNS